MKLIAIVVIRLSARHTAQPGEAFDLDDAKGCAELLAIGAAREDVAAAEPPADPGRMPPEEAQAPPTAVPAPVTAAKRARLK